VRELSDKTHVLSTILTDRLKPEFVPGCHSWRSELRRFVGRLSSSAANGRHKNHQETQRKDAGEQGNEGPLFVVMA